MTSLDHGDGQTRAKKLVESGVTPSAAARGVFCRAGCVAGSARVLHTLLGSCVALELLWSRGWSHGCRFFRTAIFRCNLTFGAAKLTAVRFILQCLFAGTSTYSAVVFAARGVRTDHWLTVVVWVAGVADAHVCCT